jgi:Amt family ammonium transporter
VFAQKALNGVADGVLFGNPGQIMVQGTAVLAAIVYSGVVSFVLLKLIALVLPLRATGSDEAVGLDIAAHGEEAYLHSDGGGGRSSLSAMEAAPSQRRVDGLVSAPVSK